MNELLKSIIVFTLLFTSTIGCGFVIGNHYEAAPSLVVRQAVIINALVVALIVMVCLI